MTDVITFTGAQSTGKTTMRKALVEYLENEGNKCISQYYGINESVARDAKNFGFTINEGTSFVTQYYIAARFIIADLETRKIAERNRSEFIILDRSVLDVIPYSNVAGDITPTQKKIISDMLLKHYRLYPTDLIYCAPIDYIEKDSFRSTDKEFQDKIVEEFKEVMVSVSDISPVIVLDNMSVEDRLEIIKGHLNF